jgi:hypothetical protein
MRNNRSRESEGLGRQVAKRINEWTAAVKAAEGLVKLMQRLAVRLIVGIVAVLLALQAVAEMAGNERRYKEEHPVRVVADA